MADSGALRDAVLQHKVGVGTGMALVGIFAAGFFAKKRLSGRATRPPDAT